MITEKDIEIIKEAEGWLDMICFTPNKYTIPDDQLEEKLAAYGMLESFKRWDGELKKNGYMIAPPMEADLKHGYITYQKDTELSVTGDHSQDVVSLLAYLTAYKLMIIYDSSNLNYFHPGYPVDTEALVMRFYEKNYHFINFCSEAQKIEVQFIDGNVYFICDANEKAYFAFDDFARLAVLLDKEMNKRYPFHTPREYEEKEKNYLAQSLTSELFVHPGFQKYNDECIPEIIIGCSYFESREECLLRAKNLMLSLNESNKDIAQGVVDAICKLETMSDEEYYRLKDKIFDV